MNYQNRHSLQLHSFLKPILTIVFIALFSCSNAQNKHISQQSLQWVQYYNQAKIGKNMSLVSDFGNRWTDGFKTDSYYLARVGLDYNVNSTMRLAGGFAHFGYLTDGKITKAEYRTYQEMNLKNVFNKFSIKHRYRIEQRSFRSVGSDVVTNSFNWRFRYAVTFSIPMVKFDKGQQLKLNVINEIFINAGKQIVNKTFDQNRLMISPTFDFNKNLSLAVTYNNQIAGTATAGDFKHANVIWFQIKQKMDFTRKRNE